MLDTSCGAQAICAVVPDAVVNKAAAGIAAFVRAGIALSRTESLDFEIERVIADHYGLAGGCIDAAGAGSHAVGLSVRPW